MSFRRDLARRSPKEWAVRLVLVVLAGGLGYYSLTFTLAQVMVKQNPGLAYLLAPYDGRVTAAYATLLAGPDATPKDRVRADTLAKRALRQDPTAVSAVATLGINADARGDKTVARRYFTYAQKLTRRDLRTQLWMIENAVERGNMPGALHEYDVTLRVFPNLDGMLYPVLASASSDPAIRAELVKILAGKPMWGEGFINFVASNGPDPQSTAALFLRLRRAGVPIPEKARAGTVDALIAAGQRDAAWSYYTALRPVADRRRSRDPQFVAMFERPSQLDWAPINDGGLTTSIQSGVFDFAAPASVGGPMLRQLQMLPPGSYRLTGHSIGIEQADGARPYWVLTCQSGRELGRVEVPNSSVSNGNFTGVFSVPADCPMQILMLMARPSDAVAGLSGQFDQVALVPAGH